MLFKHLSILTLISLSAGLPLAISTLLPGSAVAAEDLSRGVLLVANKGDHTLGIIDPVAGRQIATVDEDGVTGHEVAASPDGRRAFVPIYGNSGVGGKGTDGSLMRVIDLPSQRIIGTVDFGKGVRPHCAVFGPQNGRLYVTTELDQSVSVIDPATLKVVATIPTGRPLSHMLALAHDGRHGYTCNVGSGSVSVLDLEAHKLVTVIPVAPRAQRIALTVDDRWAITADQTKPQLAFINTASNVVARWVSLPAKAYGTAATPDGRWLLVTLPSLKQVGALDLQTMKLEHTFDVPATPQEIVIRPDGGAAFVSCDASHQVAMLDLKAWKVEKLIAAGPGADGLAWAAIR